MVQLYSFASLQVPPGLVPGLRPGSGPVDPQIVNLGDITSPETELAVEFVGISEDQQRAALAAFPGGRRFRLVIRGERSR